MDINVKLSDVQSASALSGGELMYIVQGGNSRKQALTSYGAQLISDTGVTGATGRAILAAGTAVIVRDHLDVAPYVATRTALKALDTTKDTVAILTESGREGIFKWTSDNFSTHITTDTLEGIYVEADNIDATDGAWVRVHDNNFLPEWFGGTTSAAINGAGVVAELLGGGIGISLKGGSWTVDATITLYSGVPLVLAPNAILTRASGFTGTMLRSKDFSTYTGTTDATAAYPRYIEIRGGRIDGRYMDDAFASYENKTGGNGIEIYAHKVYLDTTVQNIPGIGVWVESSTGNGDLDLDYGRQAKIKLDIQATRYEGLIWKGPADTVIEWLGQTNAGARITSAQDTGLVSSPTYGGTNGGYTDGVVFDAGAEISKIHSWGNFVGRGVVFNAGRFNADMVMAETCRYGACRILGSTYGKINNLELHRSGGYNSDTQPMLDFQSAGDDDVGWDIGVKAYHKNTSATTARNMVEIGSTARQLKLSGQLTGDNVPGHGIVIDGAANFIDLDVNCTEFLGTGPDANAASAIFRKATFNTRGMRIRGFVTNCDVAFRSSGTPRSEEVNIQYYTTDTGALAFAGDVRSNEGQRWDISGTINGTFKGSKNSGASSAIDSSITTVQTVTIAHGLIAAPAFGRYSVVGLIDTVTSMDTGAVLQQMYVQTVDTTNITAKVKFATGSATNTAPRVLWQAEV